MSQYLSWGEHAEVLVSSFAVIAIVCALRAILALVREDAMKRALNHERACARADLAHRDALLSNGMQGIVIMHGDVAERQYIGSGKVLFDLVQRSAHATKVTAAIEALMRDAKPFSFAVPAYNNSVIALRGKAVGGRAVLYLCEQSVPEEYGQLMDVLVSPFPAWAVVPKPPVSKPAPEFVIDRAVSRADLASPAPQKGMLNCLPQAIAVFDNDQVLREYNDAFVELWGLSETWLNTQPVLGDVLSQLRDDRNLPEQRQFNAWLQTQLEGFSGPDDVIRAVWHLSSGKSIQIHMPKHMDGGRLVICEDISASLHLEASLNLLTQVQKATLDTLDEGVAIFGTDGRLALHNGVFASIWRLTDGELALQPHFTEVADLCVTRFGADAIWAVVAEGINSVVLERFHEWVKLRRADDRIISLSLSRLPNGATLARFTDVTDLERFTAMQDEASGAAA